MRGRAVRVHAATPRSGRRRWPRPLRVSQADNPPTHSLEQSAADVAPVPGVVVRYPDAVKLHAWHGAYEPPGDQVPLSQTMQPLLTHVAPWPGAHPPPALPLTQVAPDW